MTKPMIRDLSVGETITTPFLVREAELVPFRNKPGRYLNLRLADRTGELVARMWEGGEEWAEALAPGPVVEVVGQVQEYQGSLQLVVRSLRLCAPEEYDWADLVPTSDRPVEEMLAELREMVEQVGQPHLRALLEAIFGDEEFLERFAQAPGASRLHHACRGGLLEHTLAVARLCGQAAADHPELNPDLLLAGALLHDVGKMEEIAPGPPWDYTDAGQFCGHVVLTDRFVLERIARVPDFPVQWQLLLTHLLLSHHGELQWGAPVRPKLPEAYALHYADNLDAKVQIVEEFRAGPEAGAGLWSRRHHALETSIYLGPTRAAPDPDEASGGETGTAPYEG